MGFDWLHCQVHVKINLTTFYPNSIPIIYSSVSRDRTLTWGQFWYRPPHRSYDHHYELFHIKLIDVILNYLIKTHTQVRDKPFIVHTIPYPSVDCYSYYTLQLVDLDVTQPQTQHKTWLASFNLFQYHRCNEFIGYEKQLIIFRWLWAIAEVLGAGVLQRDDLTTWCNAFPADLGQHVTTIAAQPAQGTVAVDDSCRSNK